jgi:predicted MFS family arabinose efflux permease
MRAFHRRLRYQALHGRKGILYSMAFMLLFFAIFDGIVMYLSPIVMQRSGIPLGTVGLILGFSSIAGMLFDILLLRLLAKSTYRKIFFAMFITASATPFFLFGPSTITFYLIAMALWGLYYNLYDIGTLDFIGRETVIKQHTSSSGILKVFEGLGYLLAPFIASLLLISLSVHKTFPLPMFLFILIAFLIFLGISTTKSYTNKRLQSRSTPSGFFARITTWVHVGKLILPILLLTLVINLVDDAIWTIGPIFSETLHIPDGPSGGLFMLAYALPPLFTGWIVGHLVKKFGKKHTALFGLFFGSLLLLVIGFVTMKFMLIAVIFCVSFLFATVWPTITAAYADVIIRSPSYQDEVETVDDYFTNIGDTIGPILGGYAAQYAGLPHTFVIIGILGMIIALVLMKYTPKNLAVQRI